MTKEAEELHDLITSSHQALEEDRKQSESSRTEPKPDIAAEHQAPAGRREQRLSSSDRGLLRGWSKLLEIVGGKLAYGAWFLILVLVVMAFVFFGGDDTGAPSNENAGTATELDQDSAATPEPDSVDVASAVPEFVDADGSTPLNGTWVMYLRNSEGTDKAAFTLRFNGVNGGTVEVLNDETESDTWIELTGDELRFGFTRTFQASANWAENTAIPFPAGGWDEKSEFKGTRVSDGQFSGNWYRDDWECRPDVNPPCSTKPDPSLHTAWIEQEP